MQLYRIILWRNHCRLITKRNSWLMNKKGTLGSFYRILILLTFCLLLRLIWKSRHFLRHIFLPVLLNHLQHRTGGKIYLVLETFQTFWNFISHLQYCFISSATIKRIFFKFFFLSFGYMNCLWKHPQSFYFAMLCWNNVNKTI